MSTPDPRDAPGSGGAERPVRSKEPPGRGPAQPGAATASSAIEGPAQPPGEINGPKGPEPTRFGDWEKNGRCTDF